MSHFHSVTRTRGNRKETLKVLNDKNLQIYEDPDSEKGRALRSEVDIPMGDYVCEYKGDLITNEEFMYRERSYLEKGLHGGYAMDIGDQQYGVRLWIDAQEEDETNKGRFINNPNPDEKANLELHLFWNREKPEAWLKANRDINLGEELLFDYGETDPRTIESFSFLKD